MKHVAVLMGGWSAEREVSLKSGTACADALRDKAYTVTRVDVGRDIAEVLAALKPDIALNMLHGPFGEDGTMQGLLEMLQVPYSHSGVLASALAMNKPRARDIFRGAGIPIAEGGLVSRFDAAQAHPLPLPYVIKPIADGSSMGVHIVTDGAPVAALADDSWTFGDTVLAEHYVAGKELTCGVMGDSALDVIEITSHLAFYDYKAKYAPGGSQHLLPAPIPQDVYTRVQEYALGAHKALGCRGVSRSDFRYDPMSGELICLEVNTQPGMTGTSLVPDMARYAGISFPELVEWMVEDASLDR
jgi:D-alanine-D-alanine ligase